MGRIKECWYRLMKSVSNAHPLRKARWRYIKRIGQATESGELGGLAPDGS